MNSYVGLAKKAIETCLKTGQVIEPPKNLPTEILKMIVQIIPILRLPPKVQIFDYLIPSRLEKEIKIGQLVLIPFRGRLKKGIIYKIRSEKLETTRGANDRISKTSRIELKAIKKIIDPVPVLSSIQLQIAEWLAQYYFSSLPLILKTILPDVPQRKVKVRSPLSKYALGSQYSSLKVPQAYLGEIKKTLERIFPQKKKNTPLSLSKFAKPFLLYCSNSSLKLVIYIKLIEKVLALSKQVIILVPQLSRISQLLDYFPAKWSKEVAILSGELSQTALWQEWQKIRAEKAKLIIGTRRAIFAPVKNLGLVIVDQEESGDFKQSDQNPRYDSRRVAEKLAELTKAKLIFSSSVPRVESYWKVKQKKYKLLLLPLAFSFSPLASLIDMRKELAKGNYSSISDLLEESIAQTLLKKEKVVLFLNRRGLATFVTCRDCHYLFSCPFCQVPVTSHLLSKVSSPLYTLELLCHHCQYKTPFPLLCPSCGGPNLQFLGRGIERVETELRKLFPKTRILKIEKEGAKKKKQTDYELRIMNYDIIIGTRFLLKYLYGKNPKISRGNFGLVAIISADTLFYLPDFRSQEKTFGWIGEIYSFVQENKVNKFFVQTYAPQNYSIRSAVEKEYEKFYEQEIKARRSLAYPPFSQLVKLVFRHKDKKKCLEETKRIFKKLKDQAGLTHESLIEPAPTFVPKSRGNWRYQIVIKTKLTSQELKSSLKPILTHLGGGWIIDREPESLL